MRKTALPSKHRDAVTEGSYDLVLVDSPPGIVAGDAIVLANRTDATLLVVRADAEERGLVGRLVGQLKHMDGVFLGVVLNRPRHAAGDG